MREEIRFMVITHAAIKVTGEKGYATEWNAEHIFDDENRALREASFVIAASDSRDKERADYVCDGSADEVEINTAINALPAGGGGIQLLEGTYDINSSIILSKDNVSINGLGRATEIQTSNAIQMIVATSKTGVFISGLKLYGNISSYGIILTSCTDSMINFCWIENHAAHGIRLWECERCIVVSCTLTDVSTQTLLLYGGSYNIIADSSFIGSGGNGIEWYISDNNIFISNLVCENFGSGIAMGSSNNNVITNNQINDNDVTNLGAYNGIQLMDSDRNIISNNRCMNNDKYEIYIFNAACDRNLILGNICYGTDHVGAIQDNGTNTELAHNVVL